MKDITMKGTATPLTLLLLTFCLSAPVSAAPIVKDGRATAEIVIPNDANPIVRTAAAEFQGIIAKMSGAPLDIVSEPSGKVKTKVWFGDNERTKRLGMDLKGSNTTDTRSS